MATNIGNTIKFPEGVDYALVKRYSGLRGLVEIDDAAELIAFLASDAGRSYHGACINIDRGVTAG
jgi:enoyl-[acyl-carrier-protein] reductase (NADH)